MNPDSSRILVLFYSRHGSTLSLACRTACGIKSVSGCEVATHIMPGISVVCETVEGDVPDNDAPYAAVEDLKTCSGLALGSPSHFGNVAATMKYFIGDTIPQWLGAEFADKSATVLINTGNLHGGQEPTLLTMMLSLLHHGMTISGIPFSEHALNHTQSDDIPHGVSYIAGHDGKAAPMPDEHEIVFAQDKRLAELVVKLAG